MNERSRKVFEQFLLIGGIISWVLIGSQPPGMSVHCQYCCETVLLSNVKQFHGWSNFIQFFGQIQYRITFICTLSFKKSFPSKPYKCLIHHLIGPYASIVVMATEYTLNRTWCNYVCFNEDILKTSLESASRLYLDMPWLCGSPLSE